MPDQGSADCRPADHRCGPRRRGDALFQAIFDATVAELIETGYAGLAMERVAARARTSKASLYRRWPGRADLVADAIAHCEPDLCQPPDTGSLRGDLLSLLAQIATRLDSPFGEALRGVLAESLADPSRTAEARTRMTAMSDARMAVIVDRAIARGEIGDRALGPRAARAANALVLHHYLSAGTPIPAEVLAEIVDEVALPLLRAVPPPASAIA